MSLILCRKESVKHPFYIDVLDLHVYSSQELCYVIYHNPLLAMNGFLTGSLLTFIKDELNMKFLAGRMEKLLEAGSKEEEVLLLFLSECDYYTEKELIRFKERTAAYRALPPEQYEKENGDYLFLKHQYVRAAACYEKILAEYGKEERQDRFVMKVYGNLGAAYAQLFQFGKAFRAYEKAYAVRKDPQFAKRIYFLQKLCPDLELLEKETLSLKEEDRQAWDQEFSQAKADAEQAREVRTFRTLAKKDTASRMEGASRMVNKWKQEYRKMV